MGLARCSRVMLVVRLLFLCLVLFCTVALRGRGLRFAICLKGDTSPTCSIARMLAENGSDVSHGPVRLTERVSSFKEECSGLGQTALSFYGQNFCSPSACPLEWPCLPSVRRPSWRPGMTRRGLAALGSEIPTRISLTTATGGGRRVVAGGGVRPCRVAIVASAGGLCDFWFRAAGFLQYCSEQRLGSHRSSEERRGTNSTGHLDIPTVWPFVVVVRSCFVL